MFHVKDVLVETTDTATNKKEVELVAEAGVIHKVDIHFRKGCFYKIHVQVYLGAVQILPTDHDESLASDGETITVREHIPMCHFRNTIRVVAWGESCLYAHTVRVRIGVLPEEQITLQKTLENLTEAVNFLGYKFRSLF